MTVDPATSYDELPYGDKVFASTHVENLATVATLVGLQPTPPQHCRVLELGCASGGNLFGMAVGLPQSQFVGIDLSPRQIEQGHATQKDLGFTNVDLRAANILDVDESYGSFDYIICHGVFSWVPPLVQEAIFRLCRERLTPQGVAYISYNAYPGWHFRGLIRDFLTFRVRKIEGMSQQIEAARGFLQFLDKTFPPAEFDYASVVRSELKMVMPEPDSYIYHEHMEAFNKPFYFYEFMEFAQRFGLQYVGEAEPHPIPATLPPETLDQLGEMADDLIEMEQYLDYYAARIFRRTLLCHAEADLSRRTSLATFDKLWVSTVTETKTENPQLLDDSPVGFETRTGVTLTSNNPVVKVAMAVLQANRPRYIPFGLLTKVVREKLPNAPPLKPDHDPVARALAESLLRCYQSHLVELRVCAPPDYLDARERPLGSPLARWQCQRDWEHVTNLRSQIVKLEGINRVLFPFLDGKHDQEGLIDIMMKLAEQGAFEIRNEGNPVTDATLMRQVLTQWVQRSLDDLMRSSLLM